MDKIIFLGTGAGSSINFYNACFAFKKNNEYMLVDGGGGINILHQFDKANIPVNNIKNIFVTHSHIDHIIGIIWVIRKISLLMGDNKYDGVVNIYANDITIDAIRTICKLTLAKSQTKFLDDRIILNVVNDKEERRILGEKFIFYDILATKEKQYGFKLNMSNGLSLVCNGDETINKDNYDFIKNSDYLIHEAFCLDSEKEVKEPYKKGHSTSKDVCIIANELDIKNLVLYHISNDDLENRQNKFINENKQYFNGDLYVPDDLEEINFKEVRVYE